MKKSSVSTGKILISLVAFWAAFGSYIFDWNHTHIFNPLWPPHAKFHNAQTMLLGTCLGLLSLWILWFKRVEYLYQLRLSVILASLYWVTQTGALLFPGTALINPEFTHPGEPPHQLIVDIIMLAMLTIAYPLELRKRR